MVPSRIELQTEKKRVARAITLDIYTLKTTKVSSPSSLSVPRSLNCITKLTNQQHHHFPSHFFTVSHFLTYYFLPLWQLNCGLKVAQTLSLLANWRDYPYIQQKGMLIYALECSDKLLSLWYCSFPSLLLCALWQLTLPCCLIKNDLFSLLSSRPGRPPKRGVPFPPMSPQDAMLHLKQSMHNGADPYKDGPFPKGELVIYIF